MNRAVRYFAAAFAVCAFSVFAYTDFNMPESLAISDYLSTFYVPAHLVAEGRPDLLYPPLDSMTFDNTLYNDRAHELITQLPKTATAAYQYPPLLALILAPLSLLPPMWSLFVFQLICLSCLALATTNILAVLKRGDYRPTDVAHYTCAAITFLPVLITIWIGQIGILVGVLPLSFAFRLLLDKKPTLAGFVMSLCMLKPQFAISAMFLAASPVMKRENKCLLALMSGAVLFLLANLLVFGPAVLGSWFHCLKISDHIFSISRAVNTQMATSLPRTIILMLPKEQIPVAKPFIYLLGACIGLAGFWAALKAMRAEISLEIKFALALMLGAVATPLAVPHVFLYDYSTLYLAGLSAVLAPWQSEQKWGYKRLVFLSWFAINAYVITLFISKRFAIPLILIAFMFVFFRRLLLLADKTSSRSQIEPASMA
jgi:hypothetical protein